MRVGISGSRRRLDRETVVATVRDLPADAVVVSGGCRGPDKWAAEAARARNMAVVEHLPDLSGARSRGEATRRYYARNQAIVDDCSYLVAFPARDRRGGTEDSIRRAVAAGKHVELVFENRAGRKVSIASAKP